MNISKISLNGVSYDVVDYDAQSKIEEIKENVYTKSEVEDLVKDVDVTTQLEDYVKASDADLLYQSKGDYVTEQALNNYSTTQLIEEKIGEAIENLDVSNLATREELEDKVDKIDGKLLSTEDFTTALKEKLDSLENYDDNTLSDKIDGLVARLDKLVGSDDVTEVIDTFNEIEDFLSGITNSESLTAMLQEMKTEILDSCSDTYQPKGNYLTDITAVAGANINSVGTPSVTVSDNNKLTFNYLKGAKGDLGEQGPQGDKGNDGTAAGFGTPTATIDSNVGTPSVAVTASGENTAKVFNFDFKNLKGASGTSAAWFTGTAVSHASGNATVTVSGSKIGDMYLNTSSFNVYSCTASNTWAYKCNIKGAKGDTGNAGATGAKGDTGAAGTNGTSAVWFTGTAVTHTSGSATVSISGSKAGDMYLNTSTLNVYTATATSTWTYTCNIKGASGAKGDAGVRGSRWNTGTAITGTSTTGTIFSGSGITDALVNDMYMNTSTCALYRCTVAGAANVAKWAFVCNLPRISKSQWGVAKLGDNIDDDGNGKISVSAANIEYAISTSTTTTKCLMDKTDKTNIDLGKLTASCLRDPDYHAMANRRASANINFSSDAGIHTFLATSTMTTGKPPEDAHIVHMEWDNGNQYAAQIAVGNTGKVYSRRLNKTTWDTSWKQLAFTDTATTSANGLMSSTDKTKLDNILGMTLFASGSILQASSSNFITLDLDPGYHYIVKLVSGNPPHSTWLVDYTIDYNQYNASPKLISGYEYSETNSLLIVRRCDAEHNYKGIWIFGCNHSATTYKVYKLPF